MPSRLKTFPPHQTLKPNDSFAFGEPRVKHEVWVQRRLAHKLALQAAEEADSKLPKFSQYDGDVPMHRFDPRTVAQEVAALVEQGVFALTTDLSFAEIAYEILIPPTCAFLVTPGVVSHPCTPRARVDKLFQAEAESWEGPRIANLADAIWILNRIDEHLVEDAAFFAPARAAERHRAKGQARRAPVPVPVYLLTRQPNGHGPRWDVRPASSRASSYQGDFPVLRLTYTKPPSPFSAS